MSTTFKVSNVSPIKISTAAVPAKNLIQKVRHGKAVEAVGITDRPILPTRNNALLGAMELSYSNHLPLALSPDDIWLTIAQGFALHVNANAEALRDRFVRHQGQQKITIRRDDFRKGSADNDWPSCFGQFSEAIANHVGKRRDLVVAGFSTTDAVTKAASEITLMDAMQKYFKYKVMTRCGIPAVTLLGTEGDWKDVRARAQVLAEYDLGWWIDPLATVLDQFVCAFSGKADVDFWGDMYKIHSGSGGDHVSGWVTLLFPYLDNRQTKQHDRRNAFRGLVTEADFPRGLSTVPFVWDYFETIYPMQLIAGFLGAEHTEGSVRPVIGWAVGEAVGATAPAEV